ncbi:MAG: hypothetical protein GTO03_14080 [Planctomycetales bacterium]|nr:hypothetical protein [Planctomycetales bacterium]
MACLTAIRPAGAETAVDLTPRRPAGQVLQVTAAYQVAGTLSLPGPDQPTRVPLAVTATATYDQRRLAVDSPRADGRDAARHARWQSARYYRQQDAKLVINGQEITPSLRETRRLIGASYSQGRLTIFSPQGPLTREELDLVEWPGDGLVADALLPKDRVTVGDRWELDPAWLAALVNIDAVGDSDVSAELTQLQRDYARIDAQGLIRGTVDGATTTIELKARCDFDLQHHRLHSLQLVLHEKRSPGEVTPGIEAVAKVRVQFRPLSRSEHLTDMVVAAMPAPPDSATLQLSFQPDHGEYRLQHDRGWHVTSDGRSTAILRRIEDGDLVGQCNISTLPLILKGKQITLESFRDDVRSTLGEHFGQFLQAGQYVDPQGHLVYHVAAVGQVTEVPVQWRYYLLGDTDGRRAAVIFTLDDSAAARFGQADRQMLAGFDFLTDPTGDSGQPAAASRPGGPAPPAGNAATQPPQPKTTAPAPASAARLGKDPSSAPVPGVTRRDQPPRSSR